MQKKSLHPLVAASAVLLTFTTAPLGAEGAEIERQAALRAHVTFLADDLLEGRGAGTRGYDLAAQYVSTQFMRLGLEPAGENTNWFQPVPLVESRLVEGSAQLSIQYGEKEKTLMHEEEFLVWPHPVRELTALRAPVAFVGFGVSAPELGYDDYEGIDVRGRIVVMLTGAPPRFPSTQRAYHSDRSRKQKLAAKHGAVGLISIATPIDERVFPWPFMLRETKFPAMNWIGAEGRPNAWHPELQGGAFLSRGGAEALCSAAGEDLGTIFENSARAVPQSKLWPVEAAVTYHSTQRRIQSPNVAGVLRGTDPDLREEFIVCTAHLDGLGIGAPIKGDSINNGAMDNAIGVSILIETAHVLAQARPGLKRSVLFLAVTAEEKGLLGSDYFAAHPTVPLRQIIANVNIDMPILLYPLADIIAFGAEHSTLGPVAARAIADAGLELSPDPMPEQVIFIRSDQYSFVKRGIPALFLWSGKRSADPSLDGDALQKKFLAETYHRPNDDIHQAFSWPGAAAFVRMNAAVITAIANAPERPTWNPGDFFGTTFSRNHLQSGSEPDPSPK